jgi:hypothetical protein
MNSRVPNDGPNPHGRPLLGAEPRGGVTGEVPHDWVLTAGDAQLTRWQSVTDDAPQAALMVVIECRIWRFSEEGSYSPKAAVGSWALARDPSHTAVRATHSAKGQGIPFGSSHHSSAGC